MFLGTYRFAGDPNELAASYDRFMSELPEDQLLVHICVKTDDGLAVFDACPSHSDFHAFSTDPAVLAAMQQAGMPAPQVHEIGEVHAALAPALIKS